MPSLCKMMCYRIRGFLNDGTLWKCGGGYIMFGGAVCLTPLFTDHESCEVLHLVMRCGPEWAAPDSFIAGPATACAGFEGRRVLAQRRGRKQGA